MKKITLSVLSFALCFIACAKDSSDALKMTENSTENNMKETLLITILNSAGTETELKATLENNSATQELVSRLKTATITLEMRPYGGFEVYGTFDFSLPTTDESLTAKCGDLMLAWGNTLSLNYGKNTYRFTRIGFLDDVKNGNLDSSGLKKILENGNCTVILETE